MTTALAHDRHGVVRLGLRENAAQFALIVFGVSIGALLAGVAADVIGLAGAMWLVAGITLISGIVAAVRMDETARLSAA